MDKLYGIVKESEARLDELEEETENREMNEDGTVEGGSGSPSNMAGRGTYGGRKPIEKKKRKERNAAHVEDGEQPNMEGAEEGKNDENEYDFHIFR